MPNSGTASTPASSLVTARDWIEHFATAKAAPQPHYLQKQEYAKAILAALDAGEALLNDLQDAVAGADLEAWDAPYRIEASSFRESEDRLRDALRPFREEPDGDF